MEQLKLQLMSMSNKSFELKLMEQRTRSSKCQQYVMECQQQLRVIGTKWEKIENALTALQIKLYKYVHFVQNDTFRNATFHARHTLEKGLCIKYVHIHIFIN